MDSQYTEEIIEALVSGHASVMVGSGFSNNADKNGYTKKHFKDWNGLADAFYEKLYGKRKDADKPNKAYLSPLKLAQQVEEVFDRKTLDNIIINELPDSDYIPSETHELLLKLPWNDVFTTNYDTLLERATAKIPDRRYNVILNQDELVDSTDAPRIVKLHGSFPGVRPFIITEEDYRRYPTDHAVFVNTVQQSLIENLFCMIGFSGDDPNFLEWIGWIRDNLGKSNTHKIYMVSVSQVSDEDKRLLESRNINIIDLDNMFPGKGDSSKAKTEKVTDFLRKLVDGVQDNKNKKEAISIDLSTAPHGFDTVLPRKTSYMKSVSDTYVGTIFFPTRYRERANNILDSVYLYKDKKGFRKYAPEERINYIFEYTRLFDTIGCPLFKTDVDFFLGEIRHILDDKDESKKAEQLEAFSEKIQFIYVQFLRCYRENFEWDKFDELLKNIEDEKLENSGRQLKYSEICKKELFSFNQDELEKNLNNWILGQDEYKWLITKAGLLAIIGKFAEAKNLLTDTLVNVRNQLMKSPDDLYLASVETSAANLINFINQAQTFFPLSYKKSNSPLSWQEENNKYASLINEEYSIHSSSEQHVEFDLTKKNTLYFGNNGDDSRKIYSMEYWRFLEDTGHVFKLGRVVIKDAFERSVDSLLYNYPSWAMIQMMIMADNKGVDFLYGRSVLSELTETDVDELVNQFIAYLEKAVRFSTDNSVFSPQSLYDQSLSVLPVVLSNLCYKSSYESMIEILDFLESVNAKGHLGKIGNLNKLFKGICVNAGKEHQRDILLRLFGFPSFIQNANRYIDPVSFFRYTDETYEVESFEYQKTVRNIKNDIYSGNNDRQQAGFNRMLVLCQTIHVKDEDLTWIINYIKNSKSVDSEYFLFIVDKKNSKEHATKFAKHIVENGISSEFLAEAAVHVNWDEINRKQFLLYVKKQIANNNDNGNILQLFDTLTCCLIHQKLRGKIFSDEEISLIDEIEKEGLGKGKSYYEILSWLVKDFSKEESLEKYRKAVVGFDQSEIEALRMLVEICYLNFDNIGEDKSSEYETFLLNLYKIAVAVLAYRAFDMELDICEETVKTITDIIGIKQIELDDVSLLVALLDKLVEKTQINNPEGYDDGETGNKKVLLRVSSVRFAAELSKRGINSPSIDMWKKIAQSNDEFAEVRNAWLVSKKTADGSEK